MNHKYLEREKKSKSPILIFITTQNCVFMNKVTLKPEPGGIL